MVADATGPTHSRFITILVPVSGRMTSWPHGPNPIVAVDRFTGSPRYRDLALVPVDVTVLVTP
jgi:hypothetical protein